MEISRIFLPLPGIDALKAEATATGCRFIDSLISEWQSGQNTFNQDGEVFIGVHDDGKLVAVGGINQDPYAKCPAVGRIPHVYVLSRCRREGIGRALVDSLLQETGGKFSEVRLRTDSRPHMAQSRLWFTAFHPYLGRCRLMMPLPCAILVNVRGEANKPQAVWALPKILEDGHSHWPQTVV